MMDQARKKGFLFWLLLLVVLFQIAFCGWYAYRSFYIDINSDSASDILHAEKIASEGGFLFSENWFNSTDLHVLSSQMFMAPLFRLNLGYRLTNAIAIVLMVALLAAVTYASARLLGCAPDVSLLAVLLAIFPDMSFSYFTLIYPSYTMILMLSLLAMALMFACEEKPRRRGVLVAALLVHLLLGVSGSRMLLMVTLPIAAFSMLLWLFKNYQAPFGLKTLSGAMHEAKTSLWILAAGIVGYAVGIFLLEPRFGGSLYPYWFASASEIGAKLQRIPMALYSFFGVGSSERNLALFALARAFALGLAVVIYTAYVTLWKRKGDPKARKLALYTLFSAAYLFLVLLNFGSGDDFISRYYVMGLFPLLFALPYALNHMPRNSVICVLAVAVCLGTFGVRTYQAQSNARQLEANDHGRSEAVMYLCNNGYQYGAATFWNANVNTVRTDGQLRFQPILYKDGAIQFRPWLTQKDNEGKSPEFFLLSRSEWDELAKDGVAVPGTVVYQDNDFVVTDARGERVCLPRLP